ncbi:MAG: hypothetical protein EOM03_16900 [Clostridia bacterium]|nr:hypothetical protein [Clostridia bacterium]
MEAIEKAEKAVKKDTKFTITDLEKGKVVKDLDSKVREAALDIRDRPDNLKPRKVTLELILNSKDGFVSVQAVAKLALPMDSPSKTICGMPDDEGNLRNLNSNTGGQRPLPIQFATEDGEFEEYE